MNWIAVIVGGGLGCALRYAVAGFWLGSSLNFPWGTLAVNVTGSLALGFLGRYFAPPHGSHAVFLFLSVGLCGGYTTFSTFALDAVTLVERGAPIRAAIYILASIIASYLAVVVGYSAARALRPPL
ncbi:MAG: fluoride efflux transporter CrcB [Gemmatimonadaceae bacterium]